MKKPIVLLSILLISLLGELLLWNSVVVFSLLLVSLAYIKHLLYPFDKEILWYLFILIGGAFVEIVLVNFGYGWSYTNPQFFGIPLWIPFFWGLVGTTIVVLYDSFTDRKN